MDNAENNTMAMKELWGLLAKEEIKFDDKDNWIGCYPHIINICILHIVSSLTKDVDDVDTNLDDKGESDDGGFVGEEDEGSDDDIDPEHYETEELKRWFTAIKWNPVKCAHAVVRIVWLI